MGLLLTIATLYVPGAVRRHKLEELLRTTADAFRTVPPVTAGLSADECLAVYARFTREQADLAIRRGDEAQVAARLFKNARHLGDELREQFNLKPPEVMRLARLVYKMLAIDFRGDPDGSIAIGRCFFSDYYSGQVCRLISSLDEGLLVGLARGGSLSFSQRITEGHECCRARLEIRGVGV